MKERVMNEFLLRCSSSVVAVAAVGLTVVLELAGAVSFAVVDINS